MSCLKTINTEEYWTLGIGLVTFVIVCLVDLAAAPIPTVAGWTNSPSKSATAGIAVGYLILFAWTVGTSVVAMLSMGKLATWQYIPVLLVAFLSTIVGANDVLRSWGLGSSIWCIIGGMLLRNCIPGAAETFAGVPKMEYFIKVSIVLLAIDLHEIGAVGGWGLIVAVVETLITIGTLLLIGRLVFKFPANDNVVMSCGISICGSSAAMTLNSIVGGENITLFITIMSLLTIPLIPLMNRMGRVIGDRAAGAWIGGSVDSTGAVIATASLGSTQMLQCAVVIKMMQNLIIGPVALVTTGVFAAEMKLRIIWDKFPKFVIGFMLVAVATTFIPHAAAVAHNSFIISEWFSALSFVMIGFDVDFDGISGYFTSGKKILLFYVVGQSIDLGFTLIAAFLAFR